jgi:hypothetical protein
VLGVRRAVVLSETGRVCGPMRRAAKVAAERERERKRESELEGKERTRSSGGTCRGGSAREQSCDRGGRGDGERWWTGQARMGQPGARRGWRGIEWPGRCARPRSIASPRQCASSQLLCTSRCAVGRTRRCSVHATQSAIRQDECSAARRAGRRGVAVRFR